MTFTRENEPAGAPGVRANGGEHRGAAEPSAVPAGAAAGPNGLVPGLLLALQRSAGNAAVGRVISLRQPARDAVIQRAKTKKKQTFVPYQIHVKEKMTREEFRALAMRQIFGGPVKDLDWQNSKDSYVPEQSPYTVQVDSRLLKEQRGQAARGRGISVAAGDGRVTGAEGRAKTFHAGPGSDEKSALMQEIDRRYYEAIGDKTETKIKKGERGKSQLWLMIRDEVLFQHEYIANLPPRVKQLIKTSTKGKDLTPAEYDRLFAVAKKIEKLPPGQIGDYASKVTAATTNLDEFEASLDQYIAEMAEREKQAEEREKIQNKLVGLDELYKRYRTYKTLQSAGTGLAIGGRYPGGGAGVGTGVGATREAMKLRGELDAELKRFGFDGITDFEAFIKKFLQAFEREAANIAQDVLKEYAGKLYRESERYKDPGELAALHQKLGGLRARYAEFEANANVWNDYVRSVRDDPSRLPGQGHVRRKGPTFAEADAAKKKAEAAKAGAQSEFKRLASEHPIFEEEGLPDDKKIDKAALAKASEQELGGLLQAQINKRQKDIGEARAEIAAKPELIYKMDMMPQFYARQGIRPGSIHDMIIQDKMREDAILKLVKGIALAIVAIALAVVTFGAATPAIIAAGAAIAGAGLGVYMALEEYQEYTEQQKLADVGLAKDPSMVWVVVAVVGAGLDMAAAAKAVGALGKAAKAFNATGDLVEFNKAVKALEEAGELEAKAARAAEKAAAARKGFAEAKGELAKALGKAYSFPGPLVDPEVYKAVLKMARQAIKAKIYDLEKFIAELNLMRTNAGMKELAPEEVVKARQAWEEAKLLEAADKARYEKLLNQIGDAAKLDDLVAKAGDVAKLEQLLKVFPQAELEAIFAQLKEGGRLALALDQLGTETAANMIRAWMKHPKGAANMNQFLERLAGGMGKELAETAAVGGKSVIIDSNTAIALQMHADPALRPLMHDGHKARVAFINSLPPGTELRLGNITVGEVGSDLAAGALKVKGLPIEVARESAEYQKLLKALTDAKLGGGGGFADRALIADAFFAKTEPGVIPRLLTGDQNAVKKLAGLAGIDVSKSGGFPGLVKKYGSTGFNVTVEGRTLTVIPVP